MKTCWGYGAVDGAVVLALLGCTSLTVEAAGFFLPYQGTAAIGNSLAGTAALGEDASTVFWNPAGMSRIKTAQVAVAGSYSLPSINFTDTGSTGPAGFATGGNGGDAGSGAFIPNLFAVVPFGQWAIGVAITPTFGNRTEYDPTWRGRFQSTESEIKTINVNPSVSYATADGAWSFGLGLNYTKLEATFTQGQVTGAPPLNGQAVLTGDNTAFGYNAGVLWQISKDTRVGVSYRSKMEFTLEGTQTVTNASGAVIAPFTFPITADLTLPAMAQLSGVHDLNEKWSLLGDLMFTQWSVVDVLQVVNSSTGANGTALPFQFKDAWRVSGAVNYRLNNAWLLRGGLAWDQSPVPGPTDRTASLPDSDRIWVSVGARWDIGDTKKNRIDFAYAYVFISDSQINRTTTGTSGMTLTGNYSNHANILSAQYTYSF
jgi:long-chain fatty acid transport protein